MHSVRRKRLGITRLEMWVLWLLIASLPATTSAQTIQPGPPYPVGMRQLQYFDPAHGGRYLALALFYPAAISERSASPFRMAFFTNLRLYKDAAVVSDRVKRPLVMFSHGRGSNGLYYAWFAEFLASHGYIVAAPYHYRANTYDSSIVYLANKLWQRPLDVSLDITFLLEDRDWAPHIDAGRIGVAGHSQGGFTALWVGGAKVDADKYLAFQRFWRNNAVVPEYLRKILPLDPGPALDVHDRRIKAVFAMAPGDIRAFGMDESTLKELKAPTYIVVGAGDTQTPPQENAAFAARYIPHAELEVIPGRVGHEIFCNECDEEGKNELAETCVDAPGIDRAVIHAQIANAALKFFDASLNVQRGQ